MSLTSSPSHFFATHWLRWARSNDALRVACLLALFVAIFAGRFSFARFFDESARSNWLELRVWFTALAMVGWMALAHRENGTLERGLRSDLRLWLSFLALFYAYFLVNALVLGNPVFASQNVADILVTAAQAFLALRIVRSEVDLVWFARIAEGVGMVLFVFCLAGFGNPEVNGVGWAPFGGPATFYRIEFLTFCCALYLYTRDREPVAYLHLPIAAIGLFSAFASLSKVAFVASLVVVILGTFWLLSTYRRKHALLLLFTAGLTLMVFSELRGELLKARVNEALSAPSLVLEAKQEWPLAVMRRIESGEKVTFYDLPARQQEFLRLIFTGADLERFPLPTILQKLSRVMVYDDSSARGRLWLHAWELFRTNPWLGAGIGYYSVEQINLYTKRIESYRYPHNIVLEVAAATGLVGLSLFALLIFDTFVLLQQRVMKDPSLVFVTGYPLFILIAALASGDYFDFRVFWLFTLIVLAAVPRVAAPRA